MCLEFSRLHSYKCTRIGLSNDPFGTSCIIFVQELKALSIFVLSQVTQSVFGESLSKPEACNLAVNNL